MLVHLVVALGLIFTPFFGHEVRAGEKVCDDLFKSLVETRTENFFGKSFQVRLPEKRRVFMDEKSGILLGMSDSGHAYLEVDGIRFDGKLFGHDEVHLSRVVDHGIVFRFDVMPETVQSVKNRIIQSRRAWSYTCIRSACQLLSQEGLNFADGEAVPTQVAAAFKRILENGFVGSGTGLPVQYEIYQIGSMDLVGAHESFEAFDRMRATPYIVFAGAGAAAAVGGAATLGVILYRDY